MKIYIDPPTANHVRRTILHPAKLRSLPLDIRERFTACLKHDDRGSYLDPTEMDRVPAVGALFHLALIAAGDPETTWFKPMRTLAAQFREQLGSSAVDRLADVIEDRSARFEVEREDPRAEAAKIIRARSLGSEPGL